MELFVFIIFSIIMTKGPDPVTAKNLVGMAAGWVSLVLIKGSLSMWFGHRIGSVWTTFKGIFFLTL